MTIRATSLGPIASFPKHRRPGGFTLVEILVATVILGLVISIVLGAFGSVLGKTDAIGHSLSHSQMVLACLNRLLVDIQATHVQPALLYRGTPEGRPPDPFRWVGETESVAGQRFSRLRFASLAHVAFGPKETTGVAQIVYYVSQTAGRGFVLRRADRLNTAAAFEPQPWDPVLCDHLHEFSIAYVDGQTNSHDHWNSEDPATGYATPRAVRVRISAGGQGQARQVHQTLIRVPVVREGEKK